MLERGRKMSGAYQLIEAEKNMWIIEEPMVRSFLLVGREKALLIDSGCMIDNMKTIVEGITKLPVVLANTHADPDHINCNMQFDTVYMHPSEYAKYHNLTKRNDNLKPLWDGDVISLGDWDIKVVSNPGHTSGCITFYDEKGRRFIGGDSIQDGMMFMFGPERDLLAAAHSLEKIIQDYGEKLDYIFPSHASCPVNAGIMSEILEGIRRMLRGEIKGRPDKWMETPIRVFDLGCVKMLYESEPEFFE